MRHIIFALCCVLAVLPARAGETSWQEVAPGVHLRLVSSGQIDKDGATMVGVEIDMPQTTKTYWRVAGDTGLPTELDFAGSTGVTDHDILWPYPTRHETADYLDYAYFGPTVLPVRLTVSAGAPQVELDAILGICSEICVPAQAHFSLSLADAAPDGPNGLRIRQALADWPMPWTGAEAIVGRVEVERDSGMLAVEVSPQLDSASLIATTGSGEPLFGTPQKSREPDLVFVPILGNADPGVLEGQAIQLTFMTDMGAFEVTRTARAAEAN